MIRQPHLLSSHPLKKYVYKRDQEKKKKITDHCAFQEKKRRKRKKE